MIDILTGLLVLITGFYAWATFRILKANERVVEVMRSQSEAMTRPYIIISPYLEPETSMVRLVISNTGKTAANHLRLFIDKSFYPFGELKEDRNLAALPAFQDEIDSFAPGLEITFGLAVGAHLFNEKTDEELTPKQFSITAEYSFGDTKVKEAHSIDLRFLYMVDVPQDLYVKHLKEIKAEIGKVSSSLKTMADKRDDQ